MKTKPCQRCNGTGAIPTPEALKAVRLAAGMTQKEIAAGLGHSEAYVSHLENGKRAVTPEVAAEYATIETETAIHVNRPMRWVAVKWPE